MILDIPLVCIILGFLFLSLVYAEIKVKVQGVFACLGALVNLAAVIALFKFGTELETILLFLLCEIVAVFALIFMQGGDKDAI